MCQQCEDCFTVDLTMTGDVIAQHGEQVVVVPVVQGPVVGANDRALFDRVIIERVSG